MQTAARKRTPARHWQAQEKRVQRTRRVDFFTARTFLFATVISLRKAVRRTKETHQTRPAPALFLTGFDSCQKRHCRRDLGFYGGGGAGLPGHEPFAFFIRS
jgi:hypothetical protein